MAVFDYDTPLGPAKAYYQTQTTNGSQGYFESFMGDQGTLLISESEVNYAGAALSGPERAGLGRMDPERIHVRAQGAGGEGKEDSAAIADVRESVAPDQHTVPVTLRDPYHQPHLQNFSTPFAGKGEAQLPAEIAYETAVAVLKVNEAIERLPAVVQARGLQGLGARHGETERSHAGRCSPSPCCGSWLAGTSSTKASRS